MQPDSERCIRGTGVATERQLWRDITSRQRIAGHTSDRSCQSYGVCSVAGHYTCYDNSDDKPRHLALCVNSLSSCLSYVPGGIASVTGYC